MKSALVFYSHYGNTAHVAGEFSEALKKIGSVDNYELEYRGGRPNLLMRAWYRLFPAAVKLVQPHLDMEKYDLLCLGIPVWGGRPSTAITKYLFLCKNLRGKKVICFFVYSIEISARRCFNYVRNVLRKKGQPLIIDVFIPWGKVHDKDFLDKEINNAIQKATASSSVNPA